LFFSFNSIIAKEKEQEKSDLKFIKGSINELLIEEEKLMAISNNPYSSVNAKNRPTMLFQAKSASILDKISDSLDDQKEIKSNLQFLSTTVGFL